MKEYGENEIYHVYNRGVDKMNIFREEADYTFFLHLLKRYLSPSQYADKLGRLAPNYADAVHLIAFCLMPNHFHLLVFLKEKEGLEHLMRSTMTAYSRYFNTKYERLGPLFQSRFLASRVSSDAYYWHISRYIHLNPMDIAEDWQDYEYSSIGYYLDAKQADWVHPEYIIGGQGGIQGYRAFVSDYEAMHSELNVIKHELANTHP